MTDIKRHLPMIIKCIKTRLQTLTEAGVMTLAADERQAILEELRALLPQSYGIGTGTVINPDGTESLPSNLLLYDRTVAYDHDYNQRDRYRVRDVLAIVQVELRLNRRALKSALEVIASAKALRPGMTTSKTSKQSVLKSRLPLGVALFGSLDLDDGPTTSETLARTLQAAIQQYAPIEQPDELWLFNDGLRFLHPILDGGNSLPCDDEHTIGITRLPRLKRPRDCYVCKAPFFLRHFFYEWLCQRCGDFNYAQRLRTADLTGRVALVTGARVNIGYAVALKLLRAGATVIATTRFPHAAAARYAQEPDAADWEDRLHLYGLDFRHLPSVQAFIEHLYRAYDRLDMLINNAAQTVRHPLEYYAPQLALEARGCAALPPIAQAMLRLTDPEPMPLLTHPLPADSTLAPPTPPTQNSWTLKLEDLSPIELVEVQLINAIVPAMLAGQLKALMLRAGNAGASIVNVAAAEGQFTQHKRGYHPHTNMAKAALNMLTHTIAESFANDGIFVNSVDPGWVSYQAPPSPDSLEELLPLDMADAAARVCDPILRGLTTGNYPFGKLFKDYRESSW